jgi:hypothetical protein
VQLPPAGDARWQPQTFIGIDALTLYDALPVEIDAGPPPEQSSLGATSTRSSDTRSVIAWRSRSQCSASGMIVPLDGIDLSRTPVLRWSWRVSEGLDLAGERTARGDDFAARVYVLFQFEPERAPISERLTHRVLEGLGGSSLPGQSLCYVWASQLPAGETWTHPRHAGVRMMSLRSGSGEPEQTGGWRHEEVDVLADREHAFGASELPRVMALAIMTDTDSSCSTASALYADFRFGPRRQAALEKSRPPAATGQGQ